MQRSGRTKRKLAPTYIMSQCQSSTIVESRLPHYLYLYYAISSLPRAFYMSAASPRLEFGIYNRPMLGVQESYQVCYIIRYPSLEKSSKFNP